MGDDAATHGEGGSKPRRKRSESGRHHHSSQVNFKQKFISLLRKFKQSESVSSVTTVPHFNLLRVGNIWINFLPFRASMRRFPSWKPTRRKSWMTSCWTSWSLTATVAQSSSTISACSRHLAHISGEIFPINALFHTPTNKFGKTVSPSGARRQCCWRKGASLGKDSARFFSQVALVSSVISCTCAPLGQSRQWC